MYILGINAIFHESSACLLKDGVILAAAEEERFNRIKHGKQIHVDSPSDLPLHAIKYCLDAAGIAMKEIEWIGYSSNPTQASLEQVPLDLFDGEQWGSQEGMETFFASLFQVPDKLAEIGFAGDFTWVDHHTAHAASAYYASPFQEAAVLSVDGIGDLNTTASFHGERNKLEFLQDVAYPHSLGLLWELLSLFLGFDVYDAAKVMGLAAYGNPDRYADQFQQIVTLLPDGKFAVDNDRLRLGSISYYPPSAYYQGLESLFALKRRQSDQALTSAHEDIAASLQALTNQVVLHMARHLHAITGSENLCLAGGVALNCVTNQIVLEEGPFANLYVQPASHDGGTALGAASYIWHHLLANGAREAMTHAYHGPSFTNTEIEAALQAQRLNYRASAQIEREVAELISQGNIVCFFQGGMEFGPRALGNRSLLADPRNPQMREILNQKIKHREYFRPFAPSVLHEEADKWFHIAKATSAAEFMLMTYPARAELREKIPAVVHVDGTSRIQSVRQAINPRYHRVISEFCNITGVPMVLNTSFNDSEPIVCTPEDAITTFLKTAIDYLAIGDFLVSKQNNGYSA